MAASQAAKEAETAESTEAAKDPKQADRDAIIKSLNEHLDAHTQMMQNLVNELLGGKEKTQGWSMAETYRKMAELAKT